MYKYTFGDILTIGKEKYHIKAVSCYQEKVPLENNMLGLKVGIEVRKLSTNEVLKWENIRGTYLAEKITDFVYNTINGQRRLYLDWRYLEEKEVEINGY